MSDFELLEIESLDEFIKAVPRHAPATNHLEALSRDLDRLAQTGDCDVRLDLSKAKFLSSGTIGAMVRLNSALEADGRRLTVIVSHRVIDVLRVIRLTALFRIVTDVNIEIEVELLERLDKWCQRTSCNRDQAIDDGLRMLLKEG
jgi:hypothetical protein